MLPSSTLIFLIKQEENYFASSKSREKYNNNGDSGNSWNISWEVHALANPGWSKRKGEKCFFNSQDPQMHEAQVGIERKKKK